MNGTVIGSIPCGFNWSGDVLEDGEGIWQITTSASTTTKTMTNNNLVFTSKYVNNNSNFSFNAVSANAYDISAKNTFEVAFTIGSGWNKSWPNQDDRVVVKLKNAETGATHTVISLPNNSTTGNYTASLDVSELEGSYTIEISSISYYDGSSSLASYTLSFSKMKFS